MMKKTLKLIISLTLCLSVFTACDNKESGGIFNESGNFDKEETLETATITSDGVVLENKTISNDLVVALNPGETLTLQNVDVQGKIVIESATATLERGIFDVAAANSYVTLNLFDSSATEIQVLGNDAFILASGKTNVNVITTKMNLYLQEQSLTNNGFNDIEVIGNGKEINICGAAIRTIDVKGSGITSLITDKSTLVENLNANADLIISGKGTVDVLVASASVEAKEAVLKSVAYKASGSVNGENDREENGNKEPEVTTTTTTTPETTTTKVVSDPKVTTTTKKNASTTTTTTKKPVTTTTTPKVTTVTTTSSAKDTTINKGNTPPTITCDDLVVTFGGTFNPLTGVTIYDAEDGYISVTSKNVKSNNVDTSKVGTYSVIYTYTDKGGLSATKTRTVKVTKALAAPTNVKAELDDDGDLVVTWDAVEGAKYYSVYLGCSTDKCKVDELRSTKTKTIIDLSYDGPEVDYCDKNATGCSEDRDAVMVITKQTTVYVVAQPLYTYDSDAKWDDCDVKSSEAGKFVYVPNKEIDTIPEKVTQSNDISSFQLKIAEEGLSTKAEGYIKVTYQGDNESTPSVLKNEKIGAGLTTDNLGKIYFKYDRSNGIKFDMAFKKVGTYYFDVIITNDDGKKVFNATDNASDSLGQYEVIVKPNSSNTGSTTNKYKGTYATINSEEYFSRFASGAVLTFSLNYDLNFEKRNTKIEVVVSWDAEDFTETEMGTVSKVKCPSAIYSDSREDGYLYIDGPSSVAAVDEKGYVAGTNTVATRNDAQNKTIGTFKCYYPELYTKKMTYSGKEVIDSNYISAGEDIEFTFDLKNAKNNDIYNALSLGYEVDYDIEIRVTDEFGDTESTYTKSHSFSPF